MEPHIGIARTAPILTFPRDGERKSEYVAAVPAFSRYLPITPRQLAIVGLGLIIRLMAEPRDYQIMVGLAKKYKSDDKAMELLKRIAANNVEFHRGHSQLAEFLVAGQRAVCMTCYAHHFPPRVKKGAPVLPLLNEGIGEVGGAVSVVKGAPRPSTALLWARWAVSEEGQRAYAEAGETPAHSKVEPLEKVRPATAHLLTLEDVKEFPRYEKLWKEAFQIR